MSVDKEIMRNQELIQSIKMVASMNVSDVVSVILELIRENDNVKSELIKIKEDKAENESTYERIIKSYQEKIETLNQKIKERR